MAQLFTTFDVYYTQQSRFEVYAPRAPWWCRTPNTFGGPVLLYPARRTPPPAPPPTRALEKKTAPEFYKGYKEIPLLFDYCENSRALGLADLCKALRTGREHRANYQQQRHVLEIMTSFSKSWEKRAMVETQSPYHRTAPMKNNPIHGVLDD